MVAANRGLDGQIVSVHAASPGAGIPRTRAALVRKPRTVRNNSGSSSRNASWPRSLSISTKETFAAAALSARTTALFSAVGNSQSEVKETTQNRVGECRNALAKE